jgi:CHAD domain-containing protein
LEKALEREAKFELPEASALPDLGGVAGGVQAARLPSLDLTARYYDTAGLRLLRRGITLRHRRDAGTGDTESGRGRWTLKLPATAGKATFARSELTWLHPPETMPEEVSALLCGVTLDEELSPVAVIHTLRRRVSLTDEAGQPLAEVDDDSVTVTPTSGGESRFREVEVELSGGGEELLGAIATALEAGGARREPDEPKLARALLLGPHPAPVAAEGAPEVELTRVAVSRGLEQLLRQDVGLRLDDDPEFVHQARVATRRMRVDLATFGARVHPGGLEQTREELKWLAAALGRVRDADVLGERLAEHAEEAGPAEAASFGELEGVVAAERNHALADLRELLASSRYLALLQELDRAATESPPAAPSPADDDDSPLAHSAAEVTELVNRRWARFRHRVEHLGHHPSNEELHAVRIAAKKVRYAADAAVPLVGEGAKHFAGDIADLQTVLGDHHDSVVAEQWCRRVAETGPTGAASAARHCVDDERRFQSRERQRWEEEWERVAHHHHPHAW